MDEQDRLRPHVKVFVGRRATRDLHEAVGPDQDLMIVATLSGG